ncbi:MAG: nucleoside-diphosphate kinase [Planctomycetes bacterium]|nr:nucleoside-diphosphate kinase [Planctomycetota bacterium]
MAIQRTFVILKPDAVQRGLTGEILARLERKGLQLVGMKFMKATETQAAKHYEEHKEKPFFKSLVQFFTSSPLVALVLDGDEAITVVRTLVGSTDGRKAPPGTIRGDFGISRSNNLVHASDSPESAVRELAIWFPEPLVTWTPATQAWIQGD